MALLRFVSCRRFILSEFTIINQSRIGLRHVSDSNKSVYGKKDSKKFKFFVINKYLDYMKKYEVLLEKRFPKAVNVYRTFMTGVKMFYTDVKEYVKIAKITNTPGNSLNSLTRREIEIYQKLPKDMKKIAPTLIISTLPLALYLIIPLLYMFPKRFLTSHFWTEEQKVKFEKEYLNERLQYLNNLYLDLLNGLHCSTSHDSYVHWKRILETLRRGGNPTPFEIVNCKSLFVSSPYHLSCLNWGHIRHLVKLHDLSIGWNRINGLVDKALILKAMDRAIVMEGGVHNLNLVALQNACIFRGLNPHGLSKEDMIRWLKNWLIISEVIDKDSASLLLHAPVLLGYNQPSNLRLLPNKNNKLSK